MKSIKYQKHDAHPALKVCPAGQIRLRRSGVWQRRSCFGCSGSDPNLKAGVFVGPRHNNEDILDHHGVAAIIKNENGEVLMQEHIKYGFWTIPVGKVKMGQGIKDGLRQELFEECNIIVEKCNEIIMKDYFYDRNGNNVKVISHLFEILKYKGEIKNNEPQKHKKQLFLSLEKIKKLPYLSDLTLLYLENLGFKREAKI